MGYGLQPADRLHGALQSQSASRQPQNHLQRGLEQCSGGGMWLPKTKPFSFSFMCCCVLFGWLGFFLVRSQHNLRRNKRLAKCFSALVEEYCYISEKIIEFTQAYEALKSPLTEPSPLKIQTLCLSTLNRNVNRLHGLNLFPWDTVDFSTMNRKVSSLNCHVMMWWWLIFNRHGQSKRDQVF